MLNSHRLSKKQYELKHKTLRIQKIVGLFNFEDSKNFFKKIVKSCTVQ